MGILNDIFEKCDLECPGWLKNTVQNQLDGAELGKAAPAAVYFIIYRRLKILAKRLFQICTLLIITMYIHVIVIRKPLSEIRKNGRYIRKNSGCTQEDLPWQQCSLKRTELLVFLHFRSFSNVTMYTMTNIPWNIVLWSSMDWPTFPSKISPKLRNKQSRRTPSFPCTSVRPAPMQSFWRHFFMTGIPHILLINFSRISVANKDHLKVLDFIIFRYYTKRVRNWACVDLEELWNPDLSSLWHNIVKKTDPSRYPTIFHFTGT